MRKIYLIKYAFIAWVSMGITSPDRALLDRISPNARKMRCTVEGAWPISLAMVLRLQCVAPLGRVSSVFRAGEPNAFAPGGMSRLTNEFAPMMALSPTVTPI
jgi:hypothetical protein